MATLQNLHADIESSFTLLEIEEEAQLGHRSQQQPPLDRSTIVAKYVKGVGYKAKVQRVQYGTYAGKKACLINFAFRFTFPAETSGRFKSANITINFSCDSGSGKKVDGHDDGDADDSDEENIAAPHVELLAPADIWGKVKESNEERTRNLNAGLQAQMPGGAPGATSGASYGRKTSQTLERRMRIQGDKRSSQDSDVDDTVFWVMDENSVQREGILPYLQCTVLLIWPEAADVVTAKVIVKPDVAFSLNPLMLYKLRSTTGAPIAFDGKTGKGTPIDIGKDFADESFDWKKVIEAPTEYLVILQPGSHSIPSSATN